MANEQVIDGAESVNQVTPTDTAPSEMDLNIDKSISPAKANVFDEIILDGKNNKTINDIDLIIDIPVQITVELGRTKISIKNLLQLAHGSVVELDGMPGEPMDVLVNGTIIAQGEVVVINEKFGIRLTDIVNATDRIRKLGK